jgi:hypothetical protein
VLSSVRLPTPRLEITQNEPRDYQPVCVKISVAVLFAIQTPSQKSGFLTISHPAFSPTANRERRNLPIEGRGERFV